MRSQQSRQLPQAQAQEGHLAWKPLPPPADALLEHEVTGDEGTHTPPPHRPTPSAIYLRNAEGALQGHWWATIQWAPTESQACAIHLAYIYSSKQAPDKDIVTISISQLRKLMLRETCPVSHS